MKTIIGKVLSDKMTKTAVVEVERFIAHPVYHKRVRKTKNYHAHNEIGAKKGDAVRLTESRPLAKTKKWRVIEVIKPHGTT
jgi:small subunit ribosomal protein S17